MDVENEGLNPEEPTMTLRSSPGESGKPGVAGLQCTTYVKDKEEIALDEELGAKREALQVSPPSRPAAQLPSPSPMPSPPPPLPPPPFPPPIHRHSSPSHASVLPRASEPPADDAAAQSAPPPAAAPRSAPSTRRRSMRPTSRPRATSCSSRARRPKRSRPTWKASTLSR